MVHGSQIMERLVVVDGAPLLDRLREGRVVGRVEGLGAPKDRFPVLQVIRNEIPGLEVKPRTDFAGNGDLALAGESAGIFQSLPFT